MAEDMYTNFTYSLDAEDYSDNNLEENYFYYRDLGQLYKPWLTETHFIPTVVVYGLAFLVGICGNALVILAIVRDLKQRTNTTVFLVSLATSDILFLIVCVPYEISRHFIYHWQLGSFLCKFSGFIEMMTAVLTVLNLTIVSLERYVAIVHPMRSRYLCTLGNLRRLLPFVWTIAALLSSPEFLIMSTEMSVFYNNQSSVNMIFCSDHGADNQIRFLFAVYQLTIMLAVPTVIMIVCYIRVVHVLWISTKQLSKLTPSNRMHDAIVLSRIETCSLGLKSPPTVPRLLKKAITNHKSKVLASRKQVIKLLLMIIVAFLLCWGPKLTLRILQKLQLPFIFSTEAYVVKVVVDCLPYIQSSINPLLYCFMSRNFRKSIRILFTRRLKNIKHESGDIEYQTVSSSELRKQNEVYVHVSDHDTLKFPQPKTKIEMHSI